MMLSIGVPSSLPARASRGSADRLPPGMLLACCLCAAFATCLSFYSIWTHLKNYRKPQLQRQVVRLLLMVPIYAIASLISLLDLEIAFFVDLVRDLYEAFVIYCFFNLLISYLGGERSLLILYHGRPPRPHLFPVNIFLPPLDLSDPYTFLALKRGILQYVQVKPVLAVATIILKASDAYGDGRIAVNNGYTWVSLIYNASVCVSLYSLAMFWACTNEDLQPFRPMPKFLCVKGIIFFSFWQGLFISILVSLGAIKSIGPVEDDEHLSIAIQDALISFEMPFFAFLHLYAFSYKDYVDRSATLVARLPVYYALRDAVGLYDVFNDSLTTIRGTGYDYQTFEPAEGVVPHGLARDRRARAGLRYSRGGKHKYWLPQPVNGVGVGEDSALIQPPGSPSSSGAAGVEGPPTVSRETLARDVGNLRVGPITAVRRLLDERRLTRQGYAPLFPDQAREVVRVDPELTKDGGEDGRSRGRRTSDSAGDDGASVTFDDPKDEEETLYERSRRFAYGDYAYPNVDISREERQRLERSREDEVLSGQARRKAIASSSGVGGGASGVAPAVAQKGKGRQEADEASEQGSAGTTATAMSSSTRPSHLAESAKETRRTFWAAWDDEAEEHAGDYESSPDGKSKDDQGRTFTDKGEQRHAINGVSGNRNHAGQGGASNDSRPFDADADVNDDEARACENDSNGPEGVSSPSTAYAWHGDDQGDEQENPWR